MLRPGGLLVVSFPVDPRLPTVDEDPAVADAAGRVARFGQHDHLRVFGADSSELLERPGNSPAAPERRKELAAVLPLLPAVRPLRARYMYGVMTYK